MELAKKVQLGENLEERYKVFHDFNDVKKLLSLRVEKTYWPAKIVTKSGRPVCRWQVPGFPFPGNIAWTSLSAATQEVPVK